MRKTVLWIAPMLVACLSTRASAADTFQLHSGDTVVFYGDSITDQRLYSMFTELYVVTRYPNLKVKFVHSGWGGDKVSGGGGGSIDVRLPRDVFAYKPTVVTIMLGMNDGKYVNHQASDDDVYYNGYRHIIDAIKGSLPGVRITAIEPSPFDDVTRPPSDQLPGGYNAVLVRYGEWIKKLCREEKLNFADLNTGVVSMLRNANRANPELAQKIIPDRVHPALGGHMIMAEQLLKAWNARSEVSSVSIDCKKAKVLSERYAKVTGLKVNDGVTWNELDEALPLPFAGLLAGDRDHTIALAIQSSDITEALDKEVLKVSGLKSRKYALKIDGQTIGTFDTDQLEQGLNLAPLDTPMSKQAMVVRDLTQKHLDLHQARWRTVQVPLEDMAGAPLDGALSALDTLEANVVAKQQEAAQPKPHTFELIPGS